MILSSEGPFAGILLGFFYGITYSDIVIPVCFLFWSLMLFVPLRGIDLQDPVTAASYGTFAAVSVTVIALAIPQEQATTTDPRLIIEVLAWAGIAAMGKWFFSYRRFQIETRTEQDEKRRKKSASKGSGTSPTDRKLKAGNK